MRSIKDISEELRDARIRQIKSERNEKLLLLLVVWLGAMTTLAMIAASLHK